MDVETIMTTEVRSCKADDGLHVAAGLMWDGDCGCVPVTDDGGKLVGIITDRDVCMAAYFSDRKLRDILVRDVMARELHCCTPDTSIEQAQAIMQTNQVRRLPVVDEDQQLVGILSLNDLAVRGVRDPLRPAELEPEYVEATLAAVSMPRPRYDRQGGHASMPR